MDRPLLRRTYTYVIGGLAILAFLGYIGHKCYRQHKKERYKEEIAKSLDRGNRAFSNFDYNDAVKSYGKIIALARKFPPDEKLEFEARMKLPSALDHTYRELHAFARWRRALSNAHLSRPKPMLKDLEWLDRNNYMKEVSDGKFMMPFVNLKTYGSFKSSPRFKRLVRKYLY